MTKEEQLREALKFVRSVRKAFIQYGDEDLNDIPAGDVIDWADDILKQSKQSRLVSPFSTGRAKDGLNRQVYPLQTAAQSY